MKEKKLIREHLDIFHVFLQLYKNERKKQQLIDKEIKLEMSPDCKKKLSTKLKNLNNISFYS